MTREIDDALRRACLDDAVRCVLLRGDGKHFPWEARPLRDTICTGFLGLERWCTRLRLSITPQPLQTPPHLKPTRHLESQGVALVSVPPGTSLAVTT